MDLEKLAGDIGHVLANAVMALMPGALGAIIAQSWERALTLPERITAVASGCVISYYVTQLVVWGFGIDPFVSQSIGFVLGLIAFKAAPGFQRSAVQFVTELPALLRDWISKRKGTDA